MVKDLKNTAYYISILKSYPLHKKSKRRLPYLRVRFIENKKIFLNIFIQKITQNRYNRNDKLRRLQYVKNLPKIFAKLHPIKEGNRYIFLYKKAKIIIKTAKDQTLHLLSIYPR